MAVEKINKTNKEILQEEVKESNVDTEKEELKNRVSELENMIKLFLQSQQQSKSEPETVQKKSLYSDIEDELNISSQAQIKIMSMIIGGLNLRALHHIVHIPDFSNVIPVSFEDLRHIVNNHPDLARDGAFIILNEKAVKALYLERDYEKLLNRNDVEHVVNLEPNQIYDILAKSTRVQLQTIVHHFLRKIAEGDSRYLDHNKLRTISDFVGTDIYALSIELNKK